MKVVKLIHNVPGQYMSFVVAHVKVGKDTIVCVYRPEVKRHRTNEQDQGFWVRPTSAYWSVQNIHLALETKQKLNSFLMSDKKAMEFALSKSV